MIFKNTSGAGPSLLVVIIGALWGLYWVPIRRLEAMLSTGPWVTFAVVFIGCLGLVPFAWKGRRRLRVSNKRALLSTALGGASFVLYSNGLLYGQVAVVILLFYLTPVWSTLIGRLWMKWPTSPWRYLAIVFGLAGIGMVLSGSHNGLPVPHTLGDVLGLTSGILWSIAATGINVHSRTKAAETNFVFCAGGAGMALLLAIGLGRDVSDIAVMEFGAEAWGWMALVGLLWWAVSLTGFMWATGRLEPARVGILLMSEVIVGAITAGLFAGEPFAGLMIIGAVLVVGAALIETLSGPYHPQLGRGASRKRSRAGHCSEQATYEHQPL
ncbi:MAG: DMT family transporter [Desulfovermiculus sp.]|nr:DMT family transporter [Desulfovermiculus sp.]